MQLEQVPSFQIFILEKQAAAAETRGYPGYVMTNGAKSANDSGNSNRPELIGCSMKPRRCDEQLISELR
jgi:hypothetical protein